MEMTNDAIIDELLKYEGGFTNDPADKGGPTNFGITAADLGRWRKLDRPASVEEVRTMQVAEARDIYKAWYIADPGFDPIADGGLRWVVVDSGVLHGTRTAARWLQQALGVTPDGVVGNQTITAANAADAAHALRGVLALRIRRYPEIVKDNPSQLRFLQGWVNRATSILQRA